MALGSDLSVELEVLLAGVTDEEETRVAECIQDV